MEKTTTKKVDHVEEEFDFGFSFVDEDYKEIKETSDKLQKDNQTSMERIKELESRLDALYHSIVPFLDNLCMNPEKSTIHWPNRVDKIQQYKEKLQRIVEGKYK